MAERRSEATVSELKATVRERVAVLEPQIIGVSRDLHAHPELAYGEQHAHDTLTAALEAAGFSVTRSACGLATAFTAHFGPADTALPVVAIVCEYDALPGLGHACGHNIIAASGLGAALAAAPAAAELGARLVVLGTPAEEGGGGKIVMINAGALDGVDVAMMIHPAGWDLTRMNTIAVHPVIARYRGRAAHAAAAPEKGVNALDAAVLGYVNVAALRQHIAADERIHGVFTHGGAQANIVPDYAETQWYVRSGTRARLEPLKDRVTAALTAGAAAAGATIELEWQGQPYAEMIDNGPLLAAFAANAADAGRDLAEPTAQRRVMGSTDMGNVSQVVASIHPMLAAAPDGTAIHTAAFAAAAEAEPGDAAALAGALCMALTAVDVWTDVGLAAEIATAFVSDVADAAATAP